MMKRVSIGLVASPDRTRRRLSFDMKHMFGDTKEDTAANHFCSSQETELVATPDRSPRMSEPPNIGSRDSSLSPLCPVTPRNSTRFLRSGLKTTSIKDALELEALITHEEYEEVEDDEALLQSTTDLFRVRPSGNGQKLEHVLAISALLDFLSSLSPFVLRNQERTEDRKQYLYSHFVSVLGEKFEKHDLIKTALIFLEENGDTISILFSCIWFLHSFGRASRVRRGVLRVRDRKRLLSKDEQDFEPKNQSATCKPRRIDSDSTVSTIADRVGGAWGVYTIMVGWQLLLLPIGFYTSVYQIFSGEAASGFHYVPRCVGDHCTLAKVVASQFKQSVFYAVCNQVAYHASSRIKDEVKQEYKLRFQRLKRFLVRFAIRHPKEFRRKLRKTLQWLRWIRYAIPIVGALNKFKGNMTDLLKKYHQRRQTQVYEKFLKVARGKRLSDLDADERLHHAVLLIQRAWRARQRRKGTRALKIFQGDPEIFAAMKLQRQFKKWLMKTRAKLKRKKAELAVLQQMARQRSMSGKSGQIMSAVQRKRMYQLQDELRLGAKQRLDRKMLLRPNTRFSVLWKCIFVSCLLVEITQLALKPKLETFHKEIAAIERRKVSAQDMDWYTYIQAKVVPISIEDWDTCGKALSENISPPFYCNRPWSDMHSLYIRLLEFAIAEALVFISVVMFLDVFITFFTGEIDDATGELIPKPFFRRWILPGIMIQLLLNPRMLEISAALKALIRHIVSDIGPARGYRWFAALFIPLFRFSSKHFNTYVWRQFVREENARTAVN